MNMMQVRVLVAGVYNGPGHRALPWAEAGAVVTVADAEYAERLMAGGCVERLGAVGPTEAPQVGPTEQPSRPRRTKQRKG